MTFEYEIDSIIGTGNSRIQFEVEERGWRHIVAGTYYPANLGIAMGMGIDDDDLYERVFVVRRIHSAERQVLSSNEIKDQIREANLAASPD